MSRKHLRDILGMSTQDWRRYKRRLIRCARAKIDEIMQDNDLEADSEEDSGPDSSHDPRYSREVHVEPLPSDSEAGEEVCSLGLHHVVHKSKHKCEDCGCHWWRSQTHCADSDQDTLCQACWRPAIACWKCGCDFARWHMLCCACMLH